MAYNKTKRILELIAGIFGVVVSSITAIGAFALIIIYSFASSNAVSMGVSTFTLIVLFFILFLWLAFSICSITFSAMVIYNFVKPESVLMTKKRKIYLLVFSFLSLNFLAFGLEIAAMCLNSSEDLNEDQIVLDKDIEEKTQTDEKNDEKV